MPGLNDWIKKAYGDLKAAMQLAGDGDTLDNAVFSTHQCAEKAFKAFLIFVHQSIPKTHDLDFLVARCAEFDPDFLLLKNESKALNPYGHDSRYPDDYFSVDRQDVEEAIAMTRKILNFVKKKVQMKEINLPLSINAYAEKAREEGIKEGELKKALNTASKMLAKGLDIKTIAELTDLSIDQVKQLQKKS